MNRINNFFFKQINACHYSILRIVFGFFLILTVFSFYKGSELNFSSGGWLAAENPTLFSFLPDSILKLFYSSIDSKIFFVVMLLFSFSITFGLFTKSSLFLAIVGLNLIRFRNEFVFCGADRFLHMMLIYLMLSPCNKVWSIDSILKANKNKMGSVFILRMIQIHIAVIYFISGFSKSLDNNWLEGNAMIMAAMNPINNSWDLNFLANYPTLIICLKYYTFLIIMWEILFPVLLFNKYSKNISFAIGISMHLGIIVFLRLEWFGYMAIASYLAYLSPVSISRLSKEFPNVNCVSIFRKITLFRNATLFRSTQL